MIKYPEKNYQNPDSPEGFNFIQMNNTKIIPVTRDDFF